MKNTKKIITLALVGAMLSATGITAFAASVTADSDPKTGGTTVNYVVDPVYTVVIPESVTLSETDAVTGTIKIYGANENSNVVIPSNQKINVALTNSENDFNVKNAAGDTIAYTVNDKNAIADLTTVAECDAGAKKDTDVTFKKTGDMVYSGTYSDTLTFGITMEDAVTAPTLAGVTLTDGMIIEPHCNVDGDDNWVQFKYVADDNKFVPNFNSYDDTYSKSAGEVIHMIASQWAMSVFLMNEEPYVNFYLTQTGNTVHLRADDGINMSVIDLQLDFDNMTYTQLYKQWYNTVSGSFSSIKIGDTTINASQMTAN